MPLVDGCVPYMWPQPLDGNASSGLILYLAPGLHVWNSQSLEFSFLSLCESSFRVLPLSENITLNLFDFISFV